MKKIRKDLTTQYTAQVVSMQKIAIERKTHKVENVLGLKYIGTI